MRGVYGLDAFATGNPFVRDKLLEINKGRYFWGSEGVEAKAMHDNFFPLPQTFKLGVSSVCLVGENPTCSVPAE